MASDFATLIFKIVILVKLPTLQLPNRKLKESWKINYFRVLTVAELQLFEKGDPDSINPEMSIDEQADLLPFNK